VGDSIQSFQPGEVVFTGPHLPHIWRCDETYFKGQSPQMAEGLVVYFGEDFPSVQWMSREEMKAVQKLFNRSRRGILFSGTESRKLMPLLLELPLLTGLDGLIKLLHVLDLLSASRQFTYLSSRIYEEEMAEDSGRMKLMYAHILKNYRQKISLTDMADMLHMTPTSFSRFFSAKNGKPLMQFIAELRIRHACTLLTEKDSSVEEICYESGFNTLSNFNRKFREITGKKPLQYRKEFLGL
jgi:AraC-like DNA-binding protein